MTSLPSGVFIAGWIFFSNLTILFNKWLMENAGFRYPVILTWWHMTFASIITQLLARTTRFLDGRHVVNMTPRRYLSAVVPIGLLYSLSMVCSTLVYLYLSVPCVQMLKAGGPVAVLLASWFWGFERPSHVTWMNIIVIAVGVIAATAGEVQFSIQGCVYQLGGIVFEALRVVMIQALLVSGESQEAKRKGTNETGLAAMDPLVSLYYFAPVCAMTNFALSYFQGWSGFEWKHATETGLGMLFLNASVAFLLNVSSVLLIGKTSGLVLCLSGILKNILLVAVAVVIWGESITGLQILGYGVALLGLVLYQTDKTQQRRQRPIVNDTAANSATYQKNDNVYCQKLKMALQRARSSMVSIMISILAFMSVLLVLAYAVDPNHFYGGSEKGGYPHSASRTVAEVDLLSSSSGGGAGGWLSWIHVADGKWWLQNS